jgi:hypothetical protein
MSGVSSAPRIAGPASRIPLICAPSLQEEDFRGIETFNDDPKWTTGKRFHACRGLSIPSNRVH